MDKLFELLDGVLLIGDDAFDQIADRDHADQFLVTQDRQVADVFVGHDRHAVLDRLLGLHKDDPRGHDVPDLCRG